ncbi:MAG: GNAT family N-acetyltransferase [Rhodobacterales bacterium]|nr:MAG: GNAT family N-acetyltransferase [Rhodobacterales bacterium]
MRLIVEPGNPRDPEIVALLEASHALMEELFPPEDNHYLSIEALCVPQIHFYIARSAGHIIGCAALADKADYGEIKSMFVASEARGKGAADALMRQLEDQARALKLPALRLETGDLLKTAIALYQRHGFTNCAPFGDYEANATSIFMEKKL